VTSTIADRAGVYRRFFVSGSSIAPFLYRPQQPGPQSNREVSRSTQNRQGSFLLVGGAMGCPAESSGATRGDSPDWSPRTDCPDRRRACLHHELLNVEKAARCIFAGADLILSFHQGSRRPAGVRCLRTTTVSLALLPVLPQRRTPRQTHPRENWPSTRMESQN
jgi:hypothetical protein